MVANKRIRNHLSNDEMITSRLNFESSSQQVNGDSNSIPMNRFASPRLNYTTTTGHTSGLAVASPNCTTRTFFHETPNRRSPYILPHRSEELISSPVRSNPNGKFPIKHRSSHLTKRQHHYEESQRQSLPNFWTSDGDPNCPSRYQSIEAPEEERNPKPIIPRCYNASQMDSDRDLPVGSTDHFIHTTDTVVQRPVLKRRSIYSFERTERLRSLLWRGSFLITFVIWGIACRHYHQANNLSVDLESLVEKSREKSILVNEKISAVKLQVQEFEARWETMTRVKNAFHHELEMLREMRDENMDMNITMIQQGQTGNMLKWIVQRKRGLEHRFEVLKNYIQEQSKRVLLNKFGSGPYQIKFKVKTVVEDSRMDLFGPQGAAKDLNSFARQNALSITKDFVVQMAPIETVPHAIHFFMELVQNNLWDNTVFLHNERMDHLMAAAPIDYATHDLRTSQLDSLHIQTLAFPEYNASYAHKVYTLGFAGRGPTFYINTQDNSQTHGPGGQGHHVLHSDGDPCFGTIIRGKEVVDALVRYGKSGRQRLDPRGSHPWTDQDLAWTRIVSAKIL